MLVLLRVLAVELFIALLQLRLLRLMLCCLCLLLLLLLRLLSLLLLARLDCVAIVLSNCAQQRFVFAFDCLY